MTGQGTETGRNALAGLPAVQSRRLHRNRLYRRGERTFSSLGRRKSSTLQDSSTWNYTYNQRSEITSAIRKNASNVTQNTMRYGFDSIGNRTSSYENPTSKTYSANSLNQYTGINVVGSSSISPQYDDDGNMTGYGSWTYTWDAENRLVKAVNGTTRLEFIYDALSRRVAKKLYQGNTLSKHERYVYDGMKLLASYNAKSSYAKINTFLWQPFGADVPLIMTYGSTIYGYLVDANKNVLGLFNPSKTRVATYLYGPSGQIISSSGTIAANNPIRFSSEQFDADLGLVYYNYRYYSPELGRWLSKDPIREKGGWNLYLMCGNNVVNVWDEKGMFEWGEMWDDFTYKVGHTVEAIDDAIGGHFEDISNFGAGWSDTLTFGLTNRLRDSLGINAVNHNASSYKAGEFTGMVHAEALAIASLSPIYTSRVAAVGLTQATGELITGTTIVATADITIQTEINKLYPCHRETAQAIFDGIRAWLFWSGVGASNRLFPGSNLRDLMWGGEIRITNNLRIAPFGNRTGNPLGERPHYHRRVVDSSGITKEGQGIGRHRPYETKSCDKSFWDRF